MSIHRRAAKRDKPESQIIHQLRDIPGVSVRQLSGPGIPDLLIGYQGNTYLVEVKSDNKAAFTPDQRAFQESWEGVPVIRAEALEDICAALGITVGTPAVVARLMSKEEAQIAINRVRQRLADTYQLIADLYDREGWRALGYPTWRACIETELGVKKSQAYRYLAAARLRLTLEADEEGNASPIPERHARALTGLQDESLRDTAYQLAQEAWRSTFPDEPTVQMSGGWVASAADVVREAIQTGGYVSLPDGSQGPIKDSHIATTAVVAAADERAKRRRLHLGGSAPLLNADYARATDAIPTLQALQDGPVRVIVYALGARDA